MKRKILFLIAFAVIATTSCNQTNNTVQSSTPQRDYLQLKIFSYDSLEQGTHLDDHFRDAMIPALHRAGAV